MPLQLPQIPGFDVFMAGNESGQGITSAVQGFQKAYAQSIENEVNRQKQEQNRLMNKYLPQKYEQEVEKNTADIALKQAQTKRQNQLAQLPGGMQHLIGAAAESVGLEYLRQTQGEDSPAYKNAKQLFDAQKEYKKRAGLGAGGNEEFLLQSLVQKDNPNLSPEEAYEASNVLRQGGDKLSNGKKINISPASRTSMDRLVKGANTAQGLNQQRFASTLETAIDSAEKNAPGAFRFSGLKAQLNLPVEKIKEQYGTANPDYQAYINFTRTDVPTIAGEYMRALGVNASDEQKRMYKEVVDPVKWDTNFDTAMARWNYFKSLGKSIGKTVGSSPSEIQQKLRGKKQSPQNIVNETISKNMSNKTGSKNADKHWVRKNGKLVLEGSSL